MSYKLLLADDSVTIQKVVELTFSDEDFQIIAVGDGLKALDRIRTEKPDIILSDVIMPGMNGYDLCGKVKGDPALRAIPFLFLKGTFESFDEDRATAAGSDGFIVKPFESQELVARVQGLVKQYRSAAAVSPPVEAPPPSFVTPPPPSVAPPHRYEAPPPPIVAAPPPYVAPPPPIVAAPPAYVAPPPPIMAAPPAYAAPPPPIMAAPPAYVAPPPPIMAAPPAYVAPPPPIVAAPPPYVAPPPPQAAAEEEVSFATLGQEPTMPTFASRSFDVSADIRPEPTKAPQAEERVPGLMSMGENAEDDLWSEVKVSDHPLPKPVELDEDKATSWMSSFQEVAPAEAEPALESFQDFGLVDEPPVAAPPPVAAQPIVEHPPVPQPPPPPLEMAIPILVAPAVVPPAPIPVAPPPPAPVAPPLPLARPGVAAPVAVGAEVEAVLAAKVEEILREIAPGIIAEVTKRVLSDILWEVVPETAERLITREIERLTGGGTR